MEPPRIAPVPAPLGLRRITGRRDDRSGGGDFERTFAEQQEGDTAADEEQPTASPLQAKAPANRRDRYAGDHHIDVIV